MYVFCFLFYQFSLYILTIYTTFSSFFSENGNVYIWGDNKYGQLGFPASEQKSLPTPQRLSADRFGHQEVVHLAVGWTHNIALTGGLWLLSFSNTVIEMGKFEKALRHTQLYLVALLPRTLCFMLSFSVARISQRFALAFSVASLFWA